MRHLDTHTHTLWIQQAVRCRRVDLRKISGDVNPADIFTKHAISRERLAKLMVLFEGDFRGGRAESAPKMRAGLGTRTTLAEANTVGQDDHDGPADPIMPHRNMSQQQFDATYPPLDVPPHHDHDYEVDQEDRLLSAGKKIAEKIAHDAKTYGRRKQVESD